MRNTDIHLTLVWCKEHNKLTWHILCDDNTWKCLECRLVLDLDDSKVFNVKD
ncbi:MAG: hypothetical protein MUP81_00815 [Dehalococcoidia bacterium]|nr:hypothetical protein [Dehalococcoidia bacterium]